MEGLDRDAVAGVMGGGAAQRINMLRPRTLKAAGDGSQNVHRRQRHRRANVVLIKLVSLVICHRVGHALRIADDRVIMHAILRGLFRDNFHGFPPHELWTMQSSVKEKVQFIEEKYTLIIAFSYAVFNRSRGPAALMLCRVSWLTQSPASGPVRESIFTVKKLP